MTETIHHHHCSPSRLAMRAGCPGSVVMEDGIPEEESEYAAEGKMLHEAVIDDEIYKSLDGEQTDAVDVCMNFLGSFEGLDWAHEEKVELWPMRMKEGFFGSGGATWKPDRTGDPLTYGYVDAYAISEDEQGKLIIAVDWKFGRGSVDEVPDNYQFGAYAAALMQKLGIDRCKFHLVQPRLQKDPLSPWYSFEFSDCAGLAKTVENIVDKCDEQRTGGVLTLSAGDHCKFCRAKLQCPAFSTQIERRVQGALEITGDNAYDMYSKASLVEKAMKEIKAKVKEFVMNTDEQSVGERGCGVRINTKRRRSIADIPKAFEAVNHLVSSNEFINGCCSVKIGDFETLLSEKLVASGMCKTKKEAKEEIPKMVEINVSESKEIATF